MQHAGDRTARAGADIGRGARDGAGDADAAEQRRADIGKALRHQLAIGAMPAAGHAVGDHRRQQRLDGAEQREGDRVGQHGLRLLQRERRQRRQRQFPRNAAEAGADGLDRQREAPRRRAPRRATAIRMPGQFGRSRLSTTMSAMLTAATATAEELAVGSPRASAASFGISSPGSLRRQRDAEQILELAGEDDDGDAGGEADRHRIGNELDVGAEPQEARGDQDDAGHQRREDHAIDAVAFGGQRHQHDEGAGRSADLKPAAAEQRHDEAADHGGVESAIRRHAGGDGDRHRQRQRDDRHRQAGRSRRRENRRGRSLRAAP